MLNKLRIISQRCFKPMLLCIPTNNLCISANSFSKTPYSKQTYYNWGDPQVLKTVITDEYVLDDLYKGYLQLKQRMKTQNRTFYSEEQMHFLIYTFLIFPRHKDILEDFIDGLKDIEAKLSQHELGQIPDYLVMAKQLLFYNFVGDEHKQFMKNVLERRFKHQPNIDSIEAIHKTIKSFVCRQISVLPQIFVKFRELIHQQLQANNFCVSKLKIKYIIETYDNIWFSSPDSIKNQHFISDIPNFQSSQQSLQNLIEFLLDLCLKSFVLKIPSNDLRELHNRIAKCDKFTSKKTKKLLNIYSCHLVIVEKMDVITFQSLLDKI